ncbi:NAD(P)-dependent alcohol dehydrogenase [Streptosporangium sp. NPDC050855]|uniref:NAD(P)-dependent alcohol dehydrogenase n=1 Tax=Streptosporangium sp. NPDC050855 TaxID=3366194 RepID=UPI0037961158
MKAIVQDRYGPADVLELRDVPRPVAGEDEVLIRVHAASVNHADHAVMTGVPYLGRLAFGPLRPKVAIRGRDVAGRVVAVGGGVRHLRPGDEVYAEAETGTFAEYVAVPADRVAVKPATLTFEEAATVPLAGGTALQGLRDRGELQPGQKVLINGASGGVGTLAVQIARALGAEVTGVCGTRNVDLVRSLGADHVVDYRREDFTRGDRRYDLILDLAGNRSLSDCRRALTPTGTLVLSSASGGRLLGPLGRVLRASVLSPFVRQRLRVLVASPSGRLLADLTELVEFGKIVPVVERTYPLHETPEALRHLAEEHARSKLVIVVPPV